MALIDRATKRAFEPEARVIIEARRATFKADSWTTIGPIEYGGQSLGQAVTRPSSYARTPAEMVTLERGALLDVTVTHALDRPASAHFTLSNVGDRWYRWAKRNPDTTQKDIEVIRYLSEVLRVSEVAERNAERRATFWDLVRKGRLRKDIGWYVRQLDNGQLVRDTPVFNREDEYAMCEFFAPDLDLMNRVWIDFKDRDGQWAPAFSGFISMVQKNRSAGAAATIRVTCKSMMAMLQKSEIVIMQSVDQTYEPFSGEEVGQLDMQAWTNTLAGLTGEEILRRVLRHVQELYCFNCGDTTQKAPEDYFYQDPVWRVNGDPKTINRKRVGTTNDVGYGDGGEDVKPVRDYIHDLTDTPDFNGKLILDPDIMRNDEGQLDIFQKVIRQTFQIYHNTNQYAYNICREVADTLCYEFFEDPRGNFHFQAPKYDYLPRVRGDLMAPNYDASRFGDYYSRLPWHGRDYILDSIGDRGLVVTTTEDGIYNYVTAATGIHFLQNSIGEFESNVFMGFTTPAVLRQELSGEIADRVLRMSRRFGVRRFNTRRLLTGFVGRNYLTRYAYAQMNRMNAAHISGVVTLHQRPDIWHGRNVFLVEEQKLGYIVGTTNTYNRSAKSAHQTTLSLAYMHHPSEHIGVPWLEVTRSARAALPEVSSDLLFDQIAEAIMRL